MGKDEHVILPKQLVGKDLDFSKLPTYNRGVENRVKNLYNDNSADNRFIVQDGPLYVNGDLHIGHLMNKTLKDFYVKYHLSKGDKVEFRFGWDCHGLPIENRAKNITGDLKDNCRAIARTYSEKQKDTIRKFGIFSTEDDYLTMSTDYVNRELKVFNDFVEKNLIYNKNKPVWYSPQLNTVLANSEIEYKDIEEDSLYFLLPIDANKKLLVWTTTEWTVKGNQAVALNPDIEYILTKEGYVCSKRFAEEACFMYEPFDATTLKTYTNVEGVECPIFFDSYVSDTETGIVHLCGGHGDDDYEILLKNGIEPKNVVEDVSDLNDHILTYRIPYDFVYKRKPNTHSYPVDWRLKEKVFKVLTEQTYLDFDHKLIGDMLKKIKLSGKDRKRLESMIFSRKDWCLSRQRFWGVKIPNSNDILDVWFDSGTCFMMNDGTPADLYIEGSDQHRGWFQSSVIIGAMYGVQPTKRILTHGFVTDNRGEKFSKSSDNSTPLDELYDKYGPDTLRMWVFMSDYKNDVVLSDESLRGATKQYFKVRNFMRYLVNNLHRTEHDHESVDGKLIESVEKLKGVVDECVGQFELSKALREVINFMTRYSSGLTEDRKNAFYLSYMDDELRVSMENEFHYLLVTLNSILFPFLPFLSEELKCGLVRTYDENLVMQA